MFTGESYEELPYRRFRRERQLAETGPIHRNIPPTEQFEAACRYNFFNGLNAHRGCMVIRRQKGHPDSVLINFRESEILDLPPEERIGNLAHDAGSVTGERVPADRPAMLKVLENLNSLLNDRMPGLPIKVCDETHSAAVVLVRGII
jgi:hypothetical protein